MTLYDDFPRILHYNGKKLKIKPEFHRVLLCGAVLSDPVLEENDKLDLCLRLLLKHWRKIPKKASEKENLFQALFQFLSNQEANTSSGTKLFDFRQDASYIYSSFWQCYGIDLLSKSGKKLHWHQFISLLEGLSEDTKLMQVISIRARPMPKATKYNAEERRALAKLKSVYRLKLTEEERKKQFEEGLAKMAIALQGMAKR